MRLDVPEGSQESDYQGRRFTWGALGEIEVYFSIVLFGRRYLTAAGEWKGHYWIRRNSWSVR